jgi:regulator of sigma E protease
MFIAGTERPQYLERPVVGSVRDSSIAASAGLLSGDSIISINGRTVPDWEYVETAFAQQEREYSLVVIRDGKEYPARMEIKHTGAAIPKDPTGGLMPPLPAIVADVLPSSAALKAGLKKNDLIRTLNGVPVHSWFEVVATMEKYRDGSPLVVDLLREGAAMSVSLTPQFDSTAKRFLIGVRVSEGKGRVIKYAPGPALSKAIDKGWSYTTMIFDVLGKLFSQKVSASQLSGPLGIIPASGFMALQGLAPILNFMALIGINLAVLNLLPLIITDGGLIFFLLIEAIRRKPLSLKTQLVFNRVAIAFFLTLFIFVSFNDVMRLPEIFRIFGK